MRLSRFSLLCMCALLVVGCAERGTPSDVPPEEVLSNAAKASQRLNSARYVVTGNFTSTHESQWDARGNVRLEGVLTHGGEQVQFQMDLDAVYTDQNSETTIDSTIEIIVAAKDEVYMHIHAISVQPTGTFFRPDVIGRVANRWWILPVEKSEGDTQVTPDPRLLHAQSRVVRVVKDNGLKTLSGRQVHHYEVELDKEKLVQYFETLALERGQSYDEAAVREQVNLLNGKGALWIDAENYFIHRLQWDIEATDKQLRLNSFSFEVNLRDHDSAPDIVIPEDAQILTPFALIGTPTPYDIPVDSYEGVDEDVLQQLLQGINPS